MRGSCGHLPMSAAVRLSTRPSPARFAAERRSDSGATVHLRLTLARDRTTLHWGTRHPKTHHRKQTHTARSRWCTGRSPVFVDRWEWNWGFRIGKPLGVRWWAADLHIAACAEELATTVWKGTSHRLLRLILCRYMHPSSMKKIR